MMSRISRTTAAKWASTPTDGSADLQCISQGSSIVPNMCKDKFSNHVVFSPNYVKNSCQGRIQSTKTGGRIIFRSSFQNAQSMVCKSRLWIVRSPAPKSATGVTTASKNRKRFVTRTAPSHHTNGVYTRKMPGWLPVNGIRHPRMFYGNGPRYSPTSYGRIDHVPRE